MLVDPRFRSDDSLGHVGDILAMINRRGQSCTRIQQGVYRIGHWNFENLIFDKVFCDPWFDRSLLGFYERLVVENPSQHRLEQLERAKTVPSQDVLDKLYRRENWKADEIGYLGAYGVCDSPEQLLSLYDFEGDPRRLCISLVRLDKKDEPPEGGWRWHKWGGYVGLQEPGCEYLHDEPVIETVYTYHIYEFMG